MRRSNTLSIPSISTSNIKCQSQLLPVLQIITLSSQNSMLSIFATHSFVEHDPRVLFLLPQSISIQLGLSDDIASCTACSVQSTRSWFHYDTSLGPCKSIDRYCISDRLFFAIFEHGTVKHEEVVAIGIRSSTLGILVLFDWIDNNFWPSTVQLFRNIQGLSVLIFGIFQILHVDIIGSVWSNACSTWIVSLDSSPRNSILRNGCTDLELHPLDNSFFGYSTTFLFVQIIYDLCLFIRSTHIVHHVNSSLTTNSRRCHGHQHLTKSDMSSIKSPPTICIQTQRHSLFVGINTSSFVTFPDQSISASGTSYSTSTQWRQGVTSFVKRSVASMIPHDLLHHPTRFAS
mmetsp:Transcript_7161/g.15801  ORF Transcript_7161/g.15801 Transcript_7161/m.15801 type:complete len:345 (+) Transcript_7161:215-1249(+)